MIARLVMLLLFVTIVDAQDLLVVTPPEYRPALEKWRKHREAQGHTIAVVAPDQDPRALVRGVHEKSGGKLRFVLLLGDVSKIPCTYSKGEVIRIWERDPRIANDNHLADLDGDDLPDLAVGRLPADNVTEARIMLDKVVRYETSRDFSTWRRRFNLIAGVGGFGWWEDFLLEQVTIKLLRSNLPAAYDLHVTYANSRSAFCPPPARVGEITLERFNEGALLVAYFGHGSRTRLDRLRFGKAAYEIFDEDDAHQLTARRGAPLVFFCACSTGHMDGAPDSLAEVAIKRPQGPVAIFASSRVSMPYANGVLAKELLAAIFLDRVATVGESLQQAKRRMMVPAPGDKEREQIEVLARAYKWKAEDRAVERAEHLFLYNLFGDPATRLPHPGEVALQCAEDAAPGARLKVVGQTPVHGEILVELVAERTPLVRPRLGDRPADFAESYARSNARVKAHTRVPVKEGAFEAVLEVPADLSTGAYFVRVYASGPDGAAMGARPLRIREKNR